MDIWYTAAIVPSIFVFISFIIWVVLNKSFGRKVTTKGTMLFKLDINQRVILRYDRKGNDITEGVLFHSNKRDQWVPLERLTKSFVGTPGEKLLRNAFVALAGGEKRVTFSFKSNSIISKKNTEVFFTISDIVDTDKFTIILRWKQVDAISTNLKDVNLLDMEKISKSGHKYKAFIAFGLDEHIEDIHKHMANNLNLVAAIKYKNMVVYEDMLIIIMSSRSHVKLNQNVKMARYEIKHIGYRIGTKSFFKSSAILSVKNADTSRKVHKVIRALDYYLNISLRTDEQFVDETNKEYKKEEYDEYVVQAKNFRAATRGGTFNLNFIPIRSIISQAKVIDFVKADVEGIGEETFNELIRNKSNYEKLLNSVATEIAINQRVKVPVIVDVTPRWLLQNAEKMNNKKAIYVLKLHMANTAPFVDAIEKLRNKGFIFGLRISEFRDSTTILIKNIRPEFVIIDKSMASVPSVEVYQQLFSIRTFASIYKFKTIFENPSTNLIGNKKNKSKEDLKRLDSIGMKYYFNHKKR
ncbi:MAG: hypothetical protein KAG04_00560 [Mycoplasmataceae bacterium]|nr:hypothetical protein [Mycoplasmataceae bacterium]